MKAPRLLAPIRKLLSKLPLPRKNHSGDVSSLAPDTTLLVVGDIHGSYELLQKRIGEVDEHIDTFQARQLNDLQLIFVGDYIDRGEKSANVLKWIFDLQHSMPDRVVALMGNHEAMMLDFLDDPVGRGHRWLRNGGLQTLASYNVPYVRENSDAEELVVASQKLEENMPDGLLDWLRALPTLYQSGNVCVCHAGLDPYLSPSDQPKRVLLWGHGDFLTVPREDGNWVVHGHTIVRQPVIGPSRISIDTGAFATGQLTIAAIETGSCRFI